MKAVQKLLIALTAIVAFPVFAGTQTATLDVPTMTCSMCPITVKKALTNVKGVSKADVSFDKKEARVTFDDAKTGADALMQATRDAGYPSTVKGGK